MNRAVSATLAALLAACSSSSGPRNSSLPSGTVSGVVSSNQGGGIAGAMVVVTPSGFTAMTAVITDSMGVYQVPGVPIGTGGGAIAVSHLPSTCAAQDTASYSSLAGGKSATANIAVPCTFAASGIVMWLSVEEGLAGLTATQLTQAFPTPMTILVGQPTGALTFDHSGNLWIAVEATESTTQNNYVYEYKPSQLTTASVAALAPTVAIQMPNNFVPFGIAFDQGGTLWVTGSNDGVLYGFSSGQLMTSGAPAPAHAFQLRDDSATTLLTPAFAPNGDLWIPGQDPNNGAGMLFRLTAAQLGSLNGRLAPVDSLLRGRGLDPAIDPAYALVFDSLGNLWVGGGGGAVPGGHSYFSLFSKTSLPGSRGDAVDVAPMLTINANLTTAGGMAFDRSGNLWNVPGFTISNPINYLLRYPAAAIAPGGSGKADVVDSLNLPPISPNGIVFVPRQDEPRL